MIANIQGEVVAVKKDQIILQVGGFGVRVFVPVRVCDSIHIGEPVFLHTYLVVREDSWTLYGFDRESEREFFELLLGVNGVGPRTALGTLSVLTVDAIRRAVVSEQPEVLTHVPGIGMKSAQRILLHLQGRVGDVEPLEGYAVTDVDTEVIEALTSLGYSVVEAQSALQAIPKDAPQEVEEKLRLALQYFS
ncbi:MAG: Holliday junction branch migration protein RuvA [Anaerolineaceae bacterium]|nr:Holliday junction branch migration protein RuvA [Anaerolineaceae bacterium]